MTEDGDTPQQDDPFPDASSVIDAFGGVRPMATRLGVAATTIQGWKSRGNIPDARRQEVRDVAAAAGIDLSDLPAIAPAQAVPESEEDAVPAAVEINPAAEEDIPADPSPAVPAEKPGGRGVAWLALVAAVAVGAALYTQPKWSPLVYGEPAASAQTVPSALLARLDALEARPAPPPLDPVVARLDALDAALRNLPDTPEAGPDLTPRIDELAAGLAQTGAQIDGLSSKLDEAAQGTKTALADVAEDLRGEVASLRDEFAVLSDQLEDLRGGNAAATGRTTGLALAVVSLEQSVVAGDPYGNVLAAVERLSDGDVNVADAVTALKADAGTGIPTRAALEQQFAMLAPTLGEPLWANTGVSWADRILARVDSMVSVRRVEDASGNALPARQAEQAVAAGDLAQAVAALADTTGPAADWVRDAERRINAENAVAALRLYAVEMLGKGLPDAGAPQ